MSDLYFRGLAQESLTRPSINIISMPVILPIIFRINVTHTFMAGGKVESFIITDGLDENEKAEFVPIRTVGNDTISTISAGVLSGGTASSKSFIHDGQTWKPVSPMLTKRATPACSLLEMDDGEVRKFQKCFSNLNRQFLIKALNCY